MAMLLPLRLRAAYHTVAADAITQLILEAHLRKGTPHLGGTQLFHVRTTNQLQDDGGRQEVTTLYAYRFAEELVNQFIG